MKFFSGFSLTNESYLFKELIDESAYSVCGFSYGAIEAFDFVQEEIKKGNRIDRLQLLSPAFFQKKNKKFKKLQIFSYVKNQEAYLAEFLKSCFIPYEVKIVQHRQTTKDELEELLYYEWDMSALMSLVNRGIAIEVYLGGKDAIIDSQVAKEFFIICSTVTFIKDANHFLQIK